MTPPRQLMSFSLHSAKNIGPATREVIIAMAMRG
jgi:hypothetical protein